MGVIDLEPLEAVVLALAVYRATLLVTSDAITAGLRQRVIDRNRDGRAAYFVTCPWCVSTWLAAGAVALVAEWGDTDALWAGAGVLALSAVAGFLASFAAPDG